MVTTNDYNERPSYGGKNYGSNLLGYLKESKNAQETPKHDCAKCENIPVKVAIAEVNEGENYVGAFNFRPVFRIPRYCMSSETVQPDIGIGYILQFNPNISNLLRKMKEDPKRIHLEDRLIDTTFGAFNFSNGAPISLSEENARNLSGLAIGGVQYIFDNPESTTPTDPLISSFLGRAGVRFSATSICVPQTEELMSFLREQWRKT